LAGAGDRVGDLVEDRCERGPDIVGCVAQDGVPVCHENVLSGAVILEGKPGAVGAISVHLEDQLSRRIEEVRDVPEYWLVDQESGQACWLQALGEQALGCGCRSGHQRRQVLRDARRAAQSDLLKVTHPQRSV
jgi:hypothetical protein